MKQGILMKQGKIIASLILCVFSYSALTQAETHQVHSSSLSESEQAQMAEIAHFAEDALVKAFDALQKIENKLTEIALLVKKGLVKLSANPITVMDVLTENKRILNALLQSQITIVALKDPIKHLEVGFIVSEFCNAFIPYVTKQIDENFKNAKPFKLHLFLKKLNKHKVRSNMSHLEPASLIKQLQITQSKLNRLDNSVQNMGLTWYNKAARTVDKYFVTPANKYHLPTITMYGTGVGLLGTYSLWKYGCFIKNNPNVPEFIRNFIKGTLLANNNGPMARDRIGNAYIIDANTDGSSVANGWSGGALPPDVQAQIPDNASQLAVLDLMINDFMMQNQPLATLGATFFIGSFIAAWKQPGGIYDKLAKKRDDLWNFLRGGEYLKTHRPGIAELKPTVSFKDMVGLDEVKEAFNSILQYIDNPEQLMRIEATPEKGWLLTGPTRTGKSFSVECLCGEIELLMEKRGTPHKMRFFNISAALVNEYGIKAILDEVRDNAPAVIFIDEIDLLGLQRVGNNKLLSEFLTSMQSSMNADPSKIVIIIAATNNPENIDKALRQNGRFGKEIRFEYPARKYRKQYIVRELHNMAVDLSQFNPDSIADKTNGRSFEDLKAVIRNAMTRSWMNGTSLTQELLEESIDTELHHIIPFERKELPESEKRIVATHFAGRAIAALHLEAHEQLDKITIHARMTDLREQGVWENYNQKDEKDRQQKIEFGAFLTKQSNDSINVKNEAIIINEATILIAGFAAEELLFGRCGFTCHKNDRERAYKLIEDLVFGGLNQKALSKSICEELKTKTFTIFQKCHVDAMQLLKDHKDALVALIEELLAKQIMNNKEIQLIIDKAEGKIQDATVATTTTENVETVVDTQVPQNDTVSSEGGSATDIDPSTETVVNTQELEHTEAQQSKEEPIAVAVEDEVISNTENKQSEEVITVDEETSNTEDMQPEETSVTADDEESNTFSDDFDDIFIAEADEEAEQKTTKSFLGTVKDTIFNLFGMSR